MTSDLNTQQINSNIRVACNISRVYFAGKTFKKWQMPDKSLSSKYNKNGNFFKCCIVLRMAGQIFSQDWLKPSKSMFEIFSTAIFVCDLSDHDSEHIMKIVTKL